MSVNPVPAGVASATLTVADDAVVHSAMSTAPLFANIADELLGALAEGGQVLSAPAGTVVFRQGEPGDTLYCVLSGEIQISTELDGATDVELRRAGPGDSFGELALLDGGARDATARAVAPSQLFVLRRDHFLAAMPRTPQVFATVVANLVQVVRATTELVFRQELERRVLRTEMELEKYRALAQMIAGVAHEINTPLGIVNTAASIVKRRLMVDAPGAASDPSADAVFSDVREAIDLIDANIRRAEKLIRDFKQLSVSHLVDTKEPLSLIEVVDEVVGLFRINARQAKLAIEIHNSLPDTASARWIGYRGFLTQVLLNLLTNIERYAYDRETGGAIHISIGDVVDRRGEHFRIAVRDWGRGMTPETRARIFEPFFTLGRNKGATGLGMSIVHNLMTTALKGTVEVSADEGAGTTVILTFPKTIPD
jgi:signal transduction histidine kinase